MITQHFVLNCLQANCCPWPWMVDTGTDGPVTLTTWDISDINPSLTLLSSVDSGIPLSSLTLTLFQHGWII